MSDFKAKLHQNTKFGWGSALDPARGAYSSPGPLAGCKGSTTEGSGVEGMGGYGWAGEGSVVESIKIHKIDPG